MITFKCELNGETVYIDCTDLNGLIMAEPNDLIFYSDYDGCQGQCRKKELTFLAIETYIQD